MGIPGDNRDPPHPILRLRTMENASLYKRWSSETGKCEKSKIIKSEKKTKQINKNYYSLGAAGQDPLRIDARSALLTFCHF